MAEPRCYSTLASFEAVTHMPEVIWHITADSDDAMIEYFLSELAVPFIEKKEEDR